MPLYKGGSKIKELYIGGRKIKELYKGSTKVFSSGLPVGTVIFASSTPGTYTVTIPETRNYDLKLVGGGGTGLYYPFWTVVLGSGAYIYGKTRLQAGTYTIVVGSKGNGEMTDGGSSSAFGQIANGGNKDGLAAQYTITLAGLNGMVGNLGGNDANSGQSLYNGYGRGGCTTNAQQPHSTDGYISIVTA